MKQTIKLYFCILAGIILISACSSTPTVHDADNFHLHPYKEITLDNGLRVLLLQDKALPRIDLQMMVMVGSLQDPQDQAGLGHLTAAMLEQGTTSRSATKFAQDMGQIASELGIQASADYTTISASTLSIQKAKLLEIFADGVLNPSFSLNEIDRQKAEIAATIAHAADNPPHYTDELMAKVVFGSHPYGKPVIGELSTVKSLARSDVVRHYFKYYRPNNAILAISGDFDDAFVDKVKATFAAWQSKAIDKVEVTPAPTVATGQVKLFTKPGLQQTQIRFVELGIPRSDPDFLALRVANTILGGDFVSRLNLHVRVELGLTYSIHSMFDSRANIGAFEISTFTRNEKAAETIRETRSVIEKYVKDGITQKELDAAKSLLAGQFPAAIETTDKLAFNLEYLRRYSVSDTYLSDFIKNLNAIKLSQVNEAIRKHIHPEQLQIVVFADQEKVAEQLKSLGSYSTELVKNPK